MLATLSITTGGCLRPDKPAAPAGPASACNAAVLGNPMGQPVSDAMVERWRVHSGARTVRIVRAGMIVTTEFNGGRLTVDVDDAGRASRVACG